MVEDQVDPGRPRLNRDLGIDIEPADIAASHRLAPIILLTAEVKG
jgi:4'-phosphopantetheinyl transferase EntD